MEQIDLEPTKSAPISDQPPAGTDKQAPADDPSMFSSKTRISAELGKLSDDELIAALTGGAEFIPWEPCKLPSRGIYYKSWNGKTECLVRAMNQTADMIMAEPRYAQSGKSLDYLFANCCKFPDPNFDPVDLIAGDRVYLIYYIRGITHGNEYQFITTCPNQSCKKVDTYMYDLNQLASTIRVANPALGFEPFKVTLPYLSETTNREFWVGIRLLRARDTLHLANIRKATKKHGMASPMARAGKDLGHGVPDDQPSIDETIDDNLDLVIHSIMGRTDRLPIQKLAKNLHSRDTATIREWLRDNTPGIDTAVTMQCQHCGTEFSIELPIKESFFRPTPSQ